jgi:hypothetical protein
MKALALVTTIAAAVVLVAAGCTPLGGPPLNLTVGAVSDSTVLVTWTSPAEGTADNYLVYFRGVTDTGYTLLADTISTSFEHNPHGATGHYKVAAKFGAATYDAVDTLATTVPVHTDTLAIFELNVDAAKSGYGWDSVSGKGRVLSMAQAVNAPLVDFYCSDLGTGSGHLPWVIISPDQADSKDSGAVGIVPGATWRKNGFHNIIGIGFENSPVPGYDSLPPNYFVFTEITQTPTLVPVYTNYDKYEDRRHYGLIKIHSVDTLAGRMVVETWYQRVPRLRLIQH